ncbi:MULTISPECIES: methyl-accepting chemotaxis protein [Halorussus]|uniref:methyl-accepting chemotaxis protein n=1 Tax=Halorussus TaxID=1070314 RepID=UPI000E2146E7|nr:MULTISPECIES: methyl-accepting chemotaxis protein [Halorussus]NHN57705.1 methyl-accepting chemotaxis protein [Halorussus sp. JP-T4]
MADRKGLRDRLGAPARWLERRLPNRVRRSYAAKFNLVLILVVVLVGAIGLFIHFDTKGLVQDDTEARITGIAHEESEAVRSWVTKKKSTTSFIASSVAADDQSAVGTTLERRLVELPGDVQSIHYLDTSSATVVESTDDAVVGSTVTADGAPWAANLTALPTGSVSVSAPYETDAGPVVAFLTPVGDARTLVLTASLEKRSRGFNSPIATGDIKVVNAEGTVVLDNRNGNLLDSYGQDGDLPDGVAAGFEGTTGFGTVSAQTGMADGRYVMATAPVIGTDWVLTYHVPKQQAYALQTQVSRNIGGLLVVMLVGLGLVAVTIGRQTAKSLDMLAAKADAIARGELDVDLPDSRRVDEMGSLFDSFGSMRSYLNTVADQAGALAAQEFDDPVLDEDVPGTFGDALDRMGEDLETMVTDVKRARDEAEAAKQEAEALSESLVREAEAFSGVMEAAADGDLTRRMDADAESEAMEQIAREFNAMMAELEATVGDVRTFAESVASASEQVTARTADIEDSSTQVSQASQQLSAGARDQQENLDTTSSEISTLSATIEEVAASADEVAQAAESTEELGEDGREAAREAIETMRAVETETEATVEQIDGLQSEMERIGEIVDLIRDIADQTNLLALNANIEAAAADGDSDGFAVVADEIKALAEESKEAVDDIEDQIEEIQDETDEAVADIRATQSQVADGVDAVDEAQESLEAIVENVEETAVGIQQINSATDEQAASTEEVVSMMDDVTRLSEESADEAEQVAAATQEQSAAVSEVTESADHLARQADELMEMLEDFRVDANGGDADVGAPAAEADGDEQDGYDPVDTDESVSVSRTE